MSLDVSKWHFDHLSVVSKTNAPALAALAKLLGLTDGYRPPFPFAGNWFYQNDEAVLHAIHRPEGEAVELNHIAFRSDMPLHVLLQHIQSLGLPYQLAHVPDQRLAQVFIRFSETLLIELDVPDEGEGRAIDTSHLIKESSMSLFDSYSLAGQSLQNRIVMAPMTRARTTQPGNIPNSLMARYYAQRASAGLIISEATQISQQGQGYSFTPGIHSAEQIEGWREVTDAVHAEGGAIYLQLWHVGRMSHPAFHRGALPVAPSAINPEASIWMADEQGVGSMVACPTPRALETGEIQGVIEDYRQAARNAVEAGFDGVEIHGANGYLIDQFLRTTSNTRTDAYGGSRDNRVRFLIEVAKAVASEVGASKTGVRLAPYITARGMNCPDIIATILYAAEQLHELGIGYIHLAEADWDDAPEISEDFRHALRQVYQGTLIVAGRYDKARAAQMIDSGLTDLVAFGRPFIANPDLPKRLHQSLPLASFSADSLFGGDAQGYTTYPAHPAL